MNYDTNSAPKIPPKNKHLERSLKSFKNHWGGGPGLENTQIKAAFSKHRPSGPMLSISQNVRLRVRLSTFELPFKRLFAPTSQSRMSNIFVIWNSWVKVMERRGLRLEHFCLEVVLNCQTKKIVFFGGFCLTKHGGNHTSQWIRDLWLKGVSLILPYL